MGKKKKPVAPNDVDAEFLQTMKTISNAIKDIDDPSETKPSESEGLDEDKHFCLSLVGQLKNLEPRYKSMVKFQIMNDVEWMKFSNSQPQIHRQHHAPFMAPMLNSEKYKEFQPYEQQSFIQHHGRKMMTHAAAANYTTLNNVGHQSIWKMNCDLQSELISSEKLTTCFKDNFSLLFNLEH